MNNSYSLNSILLLQSKPSSASSSSSSYNSSSQALSSSQMAISQRFLCLLTLLSLSTTNLLLLQKAFAFTDPLYESLLNTSTVHDLLPRFGFPKGLVPDAVKSYALSDNGDFEVELERPCYVHFDDIVYYDEKINGKLSYGVISDVSGIQAKKLFVWVPVTGIQVDSKSGLIEFYVGFLSEKLPAQQFETIPSCQRKACGGSAILSADY